MLKKILQLIKTSVKELPSYRNLPTCTSMSEKQKADNKALSKRAQRKIKNKEAEKRRKQQKREETAAESLKNDSDVVLDNHLNETTHYYQHGLRKVYPYCFTFATYAKGRWMKRSILDVFMAEFKYKDEDEIKLCIEKGKITVNGEKISTSYLLKNNDYIQNTIHRHELPVTNENVSILTNTDQLLVVNKPSSIPVHPCGRYRHNSLTYILAKQYGFKNLRTIYRLDRLTSGLMIFCKTEGRAHQMINHIKDRLVEKEYVCRVEGEFPSGVIECKEPIDVMSRKMGLFMVGPRGKEAHTTFEKLSYNGTSSVVKCKPLTGRTHQIRVHLQYLGYPIINDPLYRGPVWGPEKGKGCVYGRSEEQLIEDIFRIHNTDQYVQDTNAQPKEKEIVECVEMDMNICSATTSKDEKGCVNIENNQIICDNQLKSSDISPESSKPSNACAHLLHNKDEIKNNSSLKRNLVANEKDEDHVKQNCKMIKLDSNKVIDEESYEENKQQASVDASQDDNNRDNKCDESSNNSNSDLSIKDTVFNECLMTYDDECVECKQTYRDPSPKDLVMHLHAYRYKGPDWEFNTDLPSWAKEDWVEED